MSRIELAIRVRMMLATMVLFAGTSCGQSQNRDAAARVDDRRLGVTVVEQDPGETPSAGQTIYVPAYSAVATADNSRIYQLAITVGVRNTDLGRAIVIRSVRYHDHDGRLVREFLKSPLRLAPLASMDFFVREGDTSGGMAASFLVEWSGEQGVSNPAVEAVMIGTAGSQGISFTCPGRVVADRGR